MKQEKETSVITLAAAVAWWRASSPVLKEGWGLIAERAVKEAYNYTEVKTPLYFGKKIFKILKSAIIWPKFFLNQFLVSANGSNNIYRSMLLYLV